MRTTRHQTTVLHVIFFSDSVWVICVCVCVLVCLSICVRVGDMAHSPGCVCGVGLANPLFICRGKCESTNYVIQPTPDRHILQHDATGASFTRTQI